MCLCHETFLMLNIHKPHVPAVKLSHVKLLNSHLMSYVSEISLQTSGRNKNRSQLKEQLLYNIRTQSKVKVLIKITVIKKIAVLLR